ncbi:MAG: PIG-L family deacetylase [Clostridia bacterium]|nr:PIG-L family deacetylase [Clostridia bacterium]
MIKKQLLCLLAILFAALTLFALAEGETGADEAREIAASCAFSSSGSRNSIPRLTDRDYGTNFVCTKRRHPYIEVKSPDADVYGLYICFGDLKTRPWEVQAQVNGKWTAVYSCPGEYAHAYAPLEGLTHFRIVNSQDSQTELSISEIFLFTEGTIPDWVQKWDPTEEKADLLVLAAHPDDDILFFGGTIPYYAKERGMKVTVAYMTCGTYVRQSELLDALWYAGVRHYPVIGSMWDKYSKKIDTAYKAWDGKNNVYRYLVTLLRSLRPEVVVTHDVNGEYGHGAHRVCADAMPKAIEYAMDASKYTSAGAPWEVKKLYLHLYKENVIEMDWDAPMSAFDGMSGYEVAKEMYLKHVSQQDQGQKNEKGVFEPFKVEPRDSAYSCYRFGLAYSAVGADVEKNDFFENVPGY